MKNQLKKLPPSLLPWYEANARDLPWRKDKEPYHVWLSEIMLQQTRVEAVKGYYNRFLDALPTLQDLAAVPDDALLKLWEGLGYYNRAKNLKRAAQMIVNDYDGCFPSTFDRVIALPGIGEYTAGAICSICFGQPTPAVDGNVLRVVTRICANYTPINVASLKKEITEALTAVYPKNAASAFTQSLMELGATVCVPNGEPHCDVCPVSHLCKAQKKHLWSSLPVKPEKKPRKQENRSVFILACGNEYAVNKRPKTGLLSGLWEFPNTEEIRTKAQAVDFLKSQNLIPKDILQTVTRNHIFTHIEWKMKGFYFTVENKNDTFHWVTKEQLFQEIALPTAFRQFLELI